LEIPFLTQSRAPVLLGRLMEKCDRKPTTVVVTLLGSDGQEHDRVSLSLPADFVMRDPSAYAVRNDLVLSGF
jgi:hypothetical protein